MTTNQPTGITAKSKCVAIKQADGTDLIYEIGNDGTRRIIGRHIPVKFDEAPKAPLLPRRKKPVTV